VAFAPEARDVLARTNVIGALEEASQAAVILSRDRCILWCNRACSDLLRYGSPAELIGRPLSQISRPTEGRPAEWAAQWDRHFEGESWWGEVESFHGDGTLGRLRAGRSPIRDEEGNVVAVLGLAIDPSEELRAKEALEETEERLRAMFRYSSDIAIVFTRSGRIIFVSPSVERITGWKPSDLIGQIGWEFLHPDDVAADMKYVEDALNCGKPITREWRMRRADGSYGWFEQTLTDLSHVPAIGGIIGNFREVTERHDIEEARRESELILRRVVEVTSDAFVGLERDGVITEWNPAAEAMFGVPEREAVGHDIVELIVPQADRRFFRRAFGRVVAGDAARFLQRPFEMTGQSRDGRLFPVEVSVVHVTVGDRSQFRAFVRDIAERKATEARLAHQALTDSLTGLPNRSLLKDRLARAVSRLSRHPGSVAVMFLDLDRFKLVNDGLGHESGDDLLVEVGSRVRAAVRDTDTVARYGGDEFVIVMEEAGTLDDVRAVAARVLSTVGEPITLAGREVRPTVSIGIAMTSDDRGRPDDLVRDADIAMYRAKDRGGHRAEVFESLVDSRTIVRFELERDLRLAIGAGAGAAAAGATRSPGEASAGWLEVYYQPIYSFGTDSGIVGVEALVRWEHPSYGLMSPLEFIPLAEETGLIVPLGELVLECAVRQVVAWRESVHPDLSVSVNVAARQLDDPGLAAAVAKVLADNHLEPAALCLELTETALLRDSAGALETLERLRELGVRLAVDDFGTGYSSLVYLRRYPVQLVKLDRTFVSGVPTSREDAAIVSAVIDLAHALGMQAVAEGVETDEQRSVLAALGCELAQGYLWSPPRPVREMSELLEAHALARKGAATG
jgi:diguanylate cyclase (GGDEF)-like protein/PAS domain S-box-containing protein